MLQRIKDANSQKFIYTGKIINIKDNQIVINIISSKKIINIKQIDKIIFDDNISHDFVLGNIIMFETRSSLTINEEDELLDLIITKVIANETDKIIKLDKRETISSRIGVFPNVILEEEKQITVKKDNIIAIVITSPNECSWEYIIDNENIRLISKSYGNDISDNEEEQYLAFVANNIGESELILQQIEDNKIIRELVYKIYIE